MFIASSVLDAKPVNNTSTTKTTTTTMVMYGRTAELTTAATHERTAELTIYGTEYVECKISTNQTSPTNVTWTRNGAKIKSDIVVADSQYQVIQKLELKGEVSEVGTYVCIMTDAIGSISSSSKQLKPCKRSYLRLMVRLLRGGSRRVSKLHEGQ